MAKPNLDLLDQMPAATYWALWQETANLALQSILGFHGSCSGNSEGAATAAAEAADALLAERLERMVAIKEAREAATEAEKGAKPARR